MEVEGFRTTLFKGTLSELCTCMLEFQSSVFSWKDNRTVTLTLQDFFADCTLSNIRCLHSQVIFQNLDLKNSFIGFNNCFASGHGIT